MKYATLLLITLVLSPGCSDHKGAAKRSQTASGDTAADISPAANASTSMKELGADSLQEKRPVKEDAKNETASKDRTQPPKEEWSKRRPPEPSSRGKQPSKDGDKFLALADIAGTWDASGFHLIIEADGKGTAIVSVPDGGLVHNFWGYYTVDTTKGAPRIAFTLTGANNNPEFEFLAISKPTPNILLVKETKDRVKPNPIELKRRNVAPSKDSGKVGEQ